MSTPKALILLVFLLVVERHGGPPAYVEIWSNTCETAACFSLRRTHGPLVRNVFLARLMELPGSTLVSESAAPEYSKPYSPSRAWQSW